MVLAPICFVDFVTDARVSERVRLGCYDIPIDLSAEPLPHPVNFIVILSLRPAIYPLPRVLPNELVKGPQPLIQPAVVVTPHVGLSRDGLRHLASSRERREISRDQAVLYNFRGHSVHWDLCEGP